MGVRSELIKSIHSSYTDETYPELTERELDIYVNSVRFLEDSLLLSKTGILLIEYKNWRYLYCSNSQQVVGYSPEELVTKGPAFSLSRINLDDLKPQQRIHQEIKKYFQALHEDEKSGHKFCFTFRFRCADDKEIMMLQNDIFVKWDAQGKPIAKLIFFTDISDYKKDTNVVFYRSHIDRHGRSRLVEQRCFTRGHSISLSPRQLQVLHMVEKGLHSNAIAEKLQVSAETIRNIRKTTMRKLGCTNQAQMVKLATLYGLRGASVSIGDT